MSFTNKPSSPKSQMSVAMDLVAVRVVLVCVALLLTG